MFESLFSSSSAKTTNPSVSSGGGLFGNLFTSTPSAKPTVTTPVQKTVQTLNTPKLSTPIKLQTGITLNLTNPNQPSSAQMNITRKSLDKQAAALKQEEAIAFKITQIFPQASKDFHDLMIDPFTLKADPNKALGDAIDALKTPLLQEKDRLINYMKTYGNPKSSESAKFGTKLQVITGGANVLFSPISALFAAANDIPALGSLSKIISLPFALIGESATAVTNKAVDVLPLPKDVKANIKPGLAEITALAGQLLLGKVTAGRSGEIGDVSPVKRAELVNKYGLQDALTIETKAKDIAKAKLKAIDSGKTYSPDEIISKVVDSPLENTPEGKILIQSAIDAKNQGKSIEISTPTNEAPITVKSTDELMTFIDRQGFRTPEQLTSLKADIIKNGIKYPIELIQKLDGTFEINDGTHRIQIAKDLGISELPTRIVKTEMPKPIEPVIEKTPSKIAQSIERKAIEQKLTTGWENLAGFDKITIKEQAKMASDLVNGDFEKALRVVRGEEALPKGLRGTSLITVMEEYVKKTGDAKVAHDLANSSLVSQTSFSAQELRLAAERQPDSLALKLRDLKQAREEALKRRTGQKANDAIKNEVDNIKSEVRKNAPRREDWTSFIRSIQC